MHVAKARDDAQEVGEIKRVVNTLLQSLDSRNGTGITLAATNHDHLLDSAVWRRFDSRIEIKAPDAEARATLLRDFLVPLRVGANELDFLVWTTEGMSGADIESFVECWQTLPRPTRPSQGRTPWTRSGDAGGDPKTGDDQFASVRAGPGQRAAGKRRRAQSRSSREPVSSNP